MSACLARATDVSLCKRRLQAALGECSLAELDACCRAVAADPSTPSSSSSAALAPAADTDDDAAATDRAVRCVLRARGTQQFAVAATRGRRVGAPEPACPTVFRCNTWVGPALYLSSTPTLALRPHDADADAAAGGPAPERWMLHPTGASDVHTCTVQSCTTRLMLCVRAGEVQACEEAEHPHEQYEFVFVESHTCGLWLLLPKALKGAAVRGSSDGTLSLYRFRSGRTACAWDEGLGGAVDDRLCPNTAEWALDAGSVELEGLTVEPPTGTLPADLTAGEAEASVVFESVRHRGACLSAVRRERASTTKLAPSTLELFQLRREAGAGRWRVECPSVPEFTLVVRLVPCRYKGEPCFLLCTPELQYLTVGPGASVLRLASYEAASLWRARLHKLENHEAAAAAYRRVAGTFPNRSTRVASAAAVRRSSDVRQRVPREDEAAAAAEAAAAKERVAVEEVARLKTCLASLAARAAAREAAAVAAATVRREKDVAGREEEEEEGEAAAAAASVAVPAAVAAAAGATAAAVAAAVCVGAAVAAAAPDAVVSAWEGRVRGLLERMGQREASLRATDVGADAAPLPAWWQSRRCM